MKQKKENNDINEQMSDLKPEDFDGHTEFHRLTPEQKLEWLSQLVQFYYHEDVVKFREKGNKKDEQK